MDLSKILSIGGKPGLYKVLGQTQNNGIIVESLADKKRFPAYATNKISSLEDISIYTEEEDVPLKDVFQKMYEKHNGEKSIDPNVGGNELRNYFKEILPDFDEDRVYNSDIKKVIKWYNDLLEGGMLADFAKKEETKSEESEKSDEPTTEKKPKAPAKKSAAKKEDKSAE